MGGERSEPATCPKALQAIAPAIAPTPCPSLEREGGELQMALHFELVTPEKLVRSAEVYQVVVPGTDGDFGVLEGHAPFMSTVRDGAIQVFTSAGAAPEMIPVEGGFAEVNEKGLTVLAEKAG